MDPRRVPRNVTDPKVRQVGFFAPVAPPDDVFTSALPPPITPSPPVSGNSLSPVMIPPPRHTTSDNAPLSPLNAAAGDSFIPVGSYEPWEFSSPSATEDFSEDNFSKDSGWILNEKSGKIATSLPTGGADKAAVKQNTHAAGGLVLGVTDGGPPSEVQKELPPASSMPKKDKTTKAERRAVQEAQRAAKAAANADRSKKSAAASANANTKKVAKASTQKKDSSSVATSEKRGGDRQTDKDRKKDVPHLRDGSKKSAAASANANTKKVAKASPQKKDSSSVATSEKRGGDRQTDKDRKKDVPHPRMQFDDEGRVEKAKKRSMVKQTESRNRVELFRHLPQYEHGTQLPDLESKFFQLEPVHPSIYKVGLRFLTGDISGGNARCIAMLQAFQESIEDYSTPLDKELTRDLPTKINGYVSFVIQCRPLSISMGNAINFLKSKILELPSTMSESEAKASLLSDIDRFINEKIILADKVIVRHAVTKIRDGDVLLTYGSSSVVEMIFLCALELGKQFRVVIVDSRPKLEGRMLLRRLVGKGVSCTYTHINAVSYIMHEVTRVFLGASSVFSDGTVYSRVGTASVAMVAHQFHVPVLVCCEAYKFHKRVQLDSLCFNELGDPDAIARVFGKEDINYLDDWASSQNLQLLNLK
ncbi:probable translation initiation factor eIF-2B subunit delta [Olea europaea subsp. europaea]|uniref:Translation initiation factor eIF2B subunit delta n=1 Tax=Olea europaea subsp. europaea TaxID=158383 RepID=A0A8S0TJ58_OLEEU|nr:probable translation initiation factor eIF-2B subunit delta [Olea europaea subsp. europaea]